MILLIKSLNRQELKIFCFLAQFQHQTNKNMLIPTVVMVMKWALFMVFIKQNVFDLIWKACSYHIVIGKPL